jgi:hypothetical protein
MDGDLGTCTACGKSIYYEVEYAGDTAVNGWWIHFRHPEDGHDAQLGGPA